LIYTCSGERKNEKEKEREREVNKNNRFIKMNNIKIESSLWQDPDINFPKH